MLATSREALALRAEHCVVVSPLAVPAPDAALTVADLERTEATAMFLAAARRYDNRFRMDPAQAPVIAKICARLDGLPLAIELAAARVRLLGPEQLLARLDEDVFTTGAGPASAGSPTDPARHDRVESPAPRARRAARVLALRSVRRRSDAGGSRSVTGVRAETLEALIAKHLLQHHDDGPTGKRRLSMLETMRAYAHAQLAAGSEDASSAGATASTTSSWPAAPFTSSTDTAETMRCGSSMGTSTTSAAPSTGRSTPIRRPRSGLGPGCAGTGDCGPQRQRACAGSTPRWARRATAHRSKIS